MDLTYRDIVEILKIVDSSGFTQLTIQNGSFRLSISRGGDGTAPAVASNGAVVQEQVEVAAPPPDPAPAAGSSSNGPSASGAIRRVNVGGIERTMVQPAETVAVSPTAVAVRSPILGVFYRAPAPGSAPYVEVEQRVAAGDTLCLVESMKMFMPVAAPTDGVVVGIAAENAALVEFNQAILWIEPDPEP